METLPCRTENTDYALSRAKSLFELMRSGTGRKYKVKKNISFEEFLSLFKSNLTCLEIAKEIGYSSEAVRRIYRKYFAFLPDLTWKGLRERNKEVRLRKKKSLVPDDSLTRFIVEKAIANKFEFEMIPIREGVNRIRSLIINGKRVSICFSTKPVKTSRTKRFYFRFNVLFKSLCHYDYLFLVTLKGGVIINYFIVPTSLLTKKYCLKTYKKEEPVYFCISTQQLPPYNNIFSRVDFWQYEGEKGWEKFKECLSAESA